MENNRAMLVLAILRTGNKTEEDIRSSQGIPNISAREAQNILRYYQLLDGLKVALIRGASEEKWTLIGWPEESDARMKEAFYLMEQDPVFGTYIGQREEFLQDWEAGAYAPDGSIVFGEDEVEILGELSPKI